MILKKLILVSVTLVYKMARRPELYKNILRLSHISDQKVSSLNPGTD